MNAVAHAVSTLQGREHFMPAYGVMLQMCAQLIREKIGEEGAVLIIGAGGGLELEAFSRRAPRWRYCAVDPTPNMLAEAKDRAKACGAYERTAWVEGYVHDAPQTPFNAATCLLTLHFVPDDGGKLDTLKQIHTRLKAGAPFLLVDLCMDKSAPDYDLRLARYRQFALDSGAPVDQVDQTQARLRDVLHTVSADRDMELLAQAGFSAAELFYAGHSWRGWVAYA
jgi:tRNA (cmo5U34)-methyltransferase